MAEPEITATGAEGNRIVVELPGVGDAERERIKGLLTTPGRLEQRLVAKQDPTQGRGFPTREAALAYFKGTPAQQHRAAARALQRPRPARAGQGPSACTSPASRSR